MAIIELTPETFNAEVLDAETPILVDFNASWCPPCQALRGVLEDLPSSPAYKIASLDIDTAPDLAKKYSVSSIPCLILFENGTESARKIGLQSRKKLLKFLGAK